MNRGLYLLIASSFISACSGEEDKATVEPSTNKTPIFQEQRHVLERSRELEAMIKDSADAQRQTIEEQSQ